MNLDAIQERGLPFLLSLDSRWSTKAWFGGAALAVTIAIACSLAVSTYSEFGHTWDEPEHLAAGLALVASGDYPYDVQHPPLARLAIALGPYLAGARPYGNAGPSGEQEGRDILYRSGQYDDYLRFARFGTLAFYALLLLASWLWAQRLVGIHGAVIAVVMVAATPPLLGHAALATLDVPMAALLMLTWYLFLRWCDAPSVTRALIFGGVAGLAAGAKLSAIPFLVCSILVWLMVWRLRAATAADGRLIFPRINLLLGHGASACLCAVAALVACYGWALVPLSPTWPWPVPVGVPRLIDSFIALNAHNTEGHWSYLLGEQRRTGWWYFYLIALAVKTPLPLLILGVTGMGMMTCSGWRQRQWEKMAPALAFIAVLTFSSVYSHINIGVRHVIVLFPLLGLAASYVVIWAWKHRYPPFIRIGLVLALGWQAAILVRAHPDELAYFNELAGAHPERILIDSDLDWGQDLSRLAHELAERQIKEVSILYRGTADLSLEQLPRFHRLQPNQRVTGWIAVSVLAKHTAKRPMDYAWLDALQPVALVGKSIKLFYVPER